MQKKGLEMLVGIFQCLEEFKTVRLMSCAKQTLSEAMGDAHEAHVRDRG